MLSRAPELGTFWAQTWDTLPRQKLELAGPVPSGLGASTASPGVISKSAGGG